MGPGAYAPLVLGVLPKDLNSDARVLSSPPVIETAEKRRKVVDACLEPNKTFLEVQDLLRLDTIGPLRNFSGTCRKGLHLLDSSLR